MDESAVSEVIATVLIVGITTVLAAIVAVAVLDFTNHIPNSRIIGVSSDRMDESHITVTYHGGPDHSRLTSLTITWPNGLSEVKTAPNVGDAYLAGPPEGVTNGHKDHIVVVGRFNDGSDQVVLDKYI